MFAPGTKMALFQGLPDAKQRAEVIAFLRTKNDNPPPLPDAKAAEAAPAGATPAGAPAAGTAGGEDIVAILAKGDAKRGADVAKKCQICHSFDKDGPNLIGPNLYGVLGRISPRMMATNIPKPLRPRTGDLGLRSPDQPDDRASQCVRARYEDGAASRACPTRSSVATSSYSCAPRTTTHRRCQKQPRRLPRLPPPRRRQRRTRLRLLPRLPRLRRKRSRLKQPPTPAAPAPKRSPLKPLRRRPQRRSQPRHRPLPPQRRHQPRAGRFRQQARLSPATRLVRNPRSSHQRRSRSRLFRRPRGGAGAPTADADAAAAPSGDAAAPRRRHLNPASAEPTGRSP